MERSVVSRLVSGNMGQKSEKNLPGQSSGEQHRGDAGRRLSWCAGLVSARWRGDQGAEEENASWEHQCGIEQMVHGRVRFVEK